MINRRTFIGAFAGGLVVARSVAEARPAVRVYRIGYLALATAEPVAPPLRALKHRLPAIGAAARG